VLEEKVNLEIRRGEGLTTLRNDNIYHKVKFADTEDLDYYLIMEEIDREFEEEGNSLSITTKLFYCLLLL
jgi:hypothetical protein